MSNLRYMCHVRNYQNEHIVTIRQIDPRLATGWHDIEDLEKQLAINGVIQQIKDKPLSERIEKPRNKYHREIQPNVFVDVYDVLGAFTGKINARAKSAVDHAIKKLLAPGLRGVKEERQDLVEARDSLNRAIEILDEWA